MNAHTESHAKPRRSARETIYRNRPIVRSCRECLAVGHLRVRPAPRGDGRRGGAPSEPQELVDHLGRLRGGGVLQYGQDGGHAVHALGAASRDVCLVPAHGAHRRGAAQVPLHRAARPRRQSCFHLTHSAAS